VVINIYFELVYVNYDELVLSNFNLNKTTSNQLLGRKTNTPHEQKEWNKTLYCFRANMGVVGGMFSVEGVFLSY